MSLIAFLLSTVVGLLVAVTGPTERQFELLMRALGLTGQVLGLLHLAWSVATVFAVMFATYAAVHFVLRRLAHRFA